MKNEYKMKLVMLGNTAVGKSSIVERYVFGRFVPCHHTSTIGAQFNTKRVADKYRVDIWDTAGQERFRTLIPMYVRNAHIVVIVVSIEDTESAIQEQIAYWLKYFKDNTYSFSGELQYRVIIVYNKIDLAGSVLYKADENATAVADSADATDSADAADATAVKVAVSCKTGRNFDTFAKAVETACDELESYLIPIPCRLTNGGGEAGSGLFGRFFGWRFQGC